MTRTAITLIALAISTTVVADAAQDRRIAKYTSICKDLDRASKYAECFRPPGGYQYLYEMNNEKRAHYEKQARRSVQVRRNADRYRDKNRFR